ncbi:LOW QUALITY PROTEIN: uncharacterized protein ACMZJ9_003492 [Mantella aurantiaca]
MASAFLSAELECSVCLDTYKDPVTLKCGHNFCRVCIDRTLDTQERSGCYSCPECRGKFRERPALQRNITLCNIVENLFAQPNQPQSGVFCTYCVDFPVPAVRSCLLCEVSLCDKHLKVHKKSPEHILTDPTSSMENRKCSVHKKILEYYCTEDNTCVCVSCSLFGEHRGHQVQLFDEASRKKKETLRNVLQKLLTKREETEERVRSLQEHRRKVKEEAAGVTERVTALFIDLRRRLEVLEKRVLREISGRAERDSMSIEEMIRDLEIKKDELSRKMRHIEELCNMTDPLTVLQESATGDLCDTEDGDDEDRERYDKLLHDGGGLDVAGILHTGLSDIITEVNVYFPIQEDTYILLDVNTAHNNLHISDDRKTVSRSDIKQNRPETPERFQDYPQVLSSRSFSSGRHYWEVDVGGSDGWRVGMCYPSIDRRGGRQPLIGCNKKSWCLDRTGNRYEVIHDSNEIPLPAKISSNRVRIDLDYEAGRISFYDLCDPIRHLHTFTTTFTEPLHAGICVWKGYIKICGGIEGCESSAHRLVMSHGGGRGFVDLSANMTAVGGDQRFAFFFCYKYIKEEKVKTIFLNFFLNGIRMGRGVVITTVILFFFHVFRFSFTSCPIAITGSDRKTLQRGKSLAVTWTCFPLGRFPPLFLFWRQLRIWDSMALTRTSRECEPSQRGHRQRVSEDGQRIAIFHVSRQSDCVTAAGNGCRHTARNRDFPWKVEMTCNPILDLHFSETRECDTANWILPRCQRLSLSFLTLLSTMASAFLSAELECSICLDTYKDPVTLKCGHNFCRVCIDRTLDTQEESGCFSCPECRGKFRERPALQRNITLCNIVENLFAQPNQPQSGVFCTYCVDSPVPAVRSCLLCEVSLCDKHLRVHKKTPEHILTDPTSSMENRKCSVHKKILEYYCTEDDTCVCVSCSLFGEHRGHQVQLFDEASRKKKETLRNVLQKLLTVREKTEERVRSLQEHRRKVEEEAAGDTERVTALFIDLRRRLEVLEKRVLREISGRAERVQMSILEMILDLEIKKDELSRNIRHIEELCNMTDPLTVLQESATGDLCDTEDGDDEDRERHDKLLHDGGGLDVAGILHTGLSDIITEVNVYFPIQEAGDILLDVNTAHNDLHISDDRKIVSRSDIKQNRPKTPERFQDYPQVLSSRSFSSGRHSWEVDVGGSDGWRVGMCYPSIDRRGGRQPLIGCNKKSWGLDRTGNRYGVIHDRNGIPLPAKISSNRVRIDLDYEAGRISFYDLCDPIRHLHTFTTTFTEPLHAGICVWKGYIKICGGNQGM